MNNMDSFENREDEFKELIRRNVIESGIKWSRSESKIEQRYREMLIHEKKWKTF
jgi:hypothetical protein